MRILVTGGTGFIGRALIGHLIDYGQNVRTLIRPSTSSPNLPKGVPIDVTVSSLHDERGLRAAMVGVDGIYHLASGEWRGTQASLMDIDIKGTRAVVEAARDAGVKHIYYISHLGADRASAFPVFKAKAIAEEIIRRSGINYTILRSAVIFGQNDGFTTGLSSIMSAFPYFFLIPGNGKTLLQPLWVEDLTACITWILDDSEFTNRTIEIGGPEYLQFSHILELIMEITGLKRRIVGVRPPYIRALTVFLESFFPNLPVSVYWIDYLAANRTCGLDTMPRTFNLMPSRFSQRLDYLEGIDWRGALARSLLQRSR